MPPLQRFLVQALYGIVRITAVVATGRHCHYAPCKRWYEAVRTVAVVATCHRCHASVCKRCYGIVESRQWRPQATVATIPVQPLLCDHQSRGSGGAGGAPLGIARLDG